MRERELLAARAGPPGCASYLRIGDEVESLILGPWLRVLRVLLPVPRPQKPVRIACGQKGAYGWVSAE